MSSTRAGPVNFQYRDARGSTIGLGEVLAEGGEAKVYALTHDASLVAKVYKAANLGRETKLRAMIASPPSDPTLSQGHKSICWPEQLIYTSGRAFAGFVMGRVDFKTNRPVFCFYNPSSRHQVAIGFTWRYLVRTAMNICSVVEAIHTQGHVIGDINESNFLVSTSARVSLVDCDSMQVYDKQSGLHFRCPVGKSEFTPPELQDQPFSEVERTIDSDCFSLAVMLFLLLMEGFHPFTGVWKRSGNPPTPAENIKNGRFPYAVVDYSLVPSPLAPPYGILPRYIQSLFERSFLDGHSVPHARPRPAEWRTGLTILENSLNECRQNENHWFAAHLGGCPWCERTQLLSGLDPFPLHPPENRSPGSPKPTAHYRATRPAARFCWLPPTQILSIAVVMLIVCAAFILSSLGIVVPHTSQQSPNGESLLNRFVAATKQLVSPVQSTTAGPAPQESIAPTPEAPVQKTAGSQLKSGASNIRSNRSNDTNLRNGHFEPLIFCRGINHAGEPIGESKLFSTEELEQDGLTVYIRYGSANAARTIQISWSSSESSGSSKLYGLAPVPAGSYAFPLLLGKSFTPGLYHFSLVLNGSAIQEAEIRIEPRRKDKLSALEAHPAETVFADAGINKAPVPEARPAQNPSTEGVYIAKHKHSFGGCVGRLSLTTAEIRFSSAEHQFSFPSRDVQLDGDGIRDPSDKKWHFTVVGKNVRALLEQWKAGALHQ